MDKKNVSGLFDDFPPVSTAMWEEKITEDLKGADYEKKLVWHTLEGLRIKPYYRSEDLQGLDHVGTLPGQFPFVRGNHTTENNWDILQDIAHADPALANTAALEALAKGADAVSFNLENVDDLSQMMILLNGIDPTKNAIHLKHARNYKVVMEHLLQVSQKYGWDNQNAKGSFDFDPLAWLTLYGKFYGSADENFTDGVSLLQLAADNFPSMKVVSVNGQNYHNAGAHIVQELAFTLAQGNEYLVRLTDKGLKADQIAPMIKFSLAVGSNYFLEIGKLRAVRWLWAKIVEQYQPATKESCRMHLHTVTSSWNKSIYDPYVNLLRSTTEAMAATIAGVESLTIQPFDGSFRKSATFSERVARNQHIVLRNEAYFSKVADPSAGSYYIENITDNIADAAWKLFLEIEKAGGFIKAVSSGFIQNEIEKTCQKRDMDIAMRKHVFVGVNQYPNPQEKMLNQIEPTAKPADLAILRPYRGPQAFEAMRLAVENYEQKGFEVPLVYLLTYGNLTMRKARATFASNFFGCAGYKIMEGPGTKTIKEGLEKVLDTNPRIIVFCSSDEEYDELITAAETIGQSHPDIQMVVAGNPKEITDQLSAAGVKHFIHLRTNALESLQRFNDLLGIA